MLYQATVLYIPNGEGHQTASENGVAGDLRIAIKVKEHPLLVRKGFDLYVDVYAPITTLILGGKVQVPTLKGTTNLDNATTFRMMLFVTICSK